MQPRLEPAPLRPTFAILPTTHLALPAACLLLAACLEQDEKVTVSPDGSVEVEIRVSGDLPDFAEGYAVPLHGPWKPLDEETRDWIARVGPDTGSRAVQAAVDAGAWPEDEAHLAVAARFDSVGSMPRFFAPPEEPYVSSYLERSTSLEVLEQGSRRVFVFERHLHARPSHHRFWSDGAFPEELGDKLDEERQLSDEEWEALAESLRSFLVHSIELLVRDSIEPLYTEVRAGFPAAATERVVNRCTTAVAGLAGTAEVVRLLHESWEHADREDSGEESPLARWGLKIRELTRRELTRALEGEAVTEENRHAVLGRFEWNLSAHDHTQDLGDEKLRLDLGLPGTIVSGNFDRLADGRAQWEVEGGRLRRSGVVLRAVSVLE